MEIVRVIASAAAAYVVGAIWYVVLARHWVAASGIMTDPSGRPINSGSTPYVIAAVAMIVVAGMMRHIFAMAAIATIGAGAAAGFGLGAFVILPWIAMNYGYSARPMALTLIDGGYAVFGCTIIGAVLTLI